jgi:hypothetical protein
MIEALYFNVRRLPVGGRVTPCAVRAKASLVLVLVAGDAAGREPHPGTIQVFAGQQSTRRRGNVLCRVTGSATDSGVFAVEQKACCRVVETLGSRIPMNHLEVRAVVIGVAFYARLTRQAGVRKRCMQALALLNLRGNFPVTFGAAEGWRFGVALVALDAVCSSGQALMRSRQRAGRNLCIHTGGKGEEEKERKKARCTLLCVSPFDLNSAVRELIFNVHSYVHSVVPCLYSRGLETAMAAY